MTSRESIRAPGALVLVQPAPAVSIEDLYDTVFQYQLFPGQPRRQHQFVGEKAPRRCRFCTGAAATFSQRCHVMPEGFGNRELFTLEECDTCNGNAGRTVEDQFAKFLAPIRALLPIVSRKGGAKHKPADGSSIQSIPGRPVRLEIHEDDPTIAVIARGDEELTVQVQKQPFNPMDVCRALARMGLMVVPGREFERLRYLVPWIRREVEAPSMLTQYHIPGTGLRWSSLVVYRQRQPLIGESPLVVAYSFGTVILVWHSPTPTLSAPSGPVFPAVGFSPYAPHVVERNTKPIERSELVPGTLDVTTIHFGSRRELSAEEAADAERWGL